MTRSHSRRWPGVRRSASVGVALFPLGVPVSPLGARLVAELTEALIEVLLRFIGCSRGVFRTAGIRGVRAESALPPPRSGAGAPATNIAGHVLVCRFRITLLASIVNRILRTLHVNRMTRA